MSSPDLKGMPVDKNADELFESIQQHASLLIQRTEDTELRERLRELLDQFEDEKRLAQFAARISPYPEVSTLVYERLLDYDPANVDLVLRLGSIHFMAGDDTSASSYLKQARALEGETARVLFLEATLAQDNEEKKRIYTQILNQEPDNRTAWEHLLTLGEGR